MDEKKLVVIRDRRKVNQFSIHNVLIDHWLPIIGQIGFLLYAFYSRLASKDSEKAFPGYTLIRKHLKLGRGSISEHNRLLVWCGLIHIEEGGRRKANEYYILAVPEVTPERIERIRALVLADAERRRAERLAEADKLEAEAAQFEKGSSSQAEQLKKVKKLRAEAADKFVATVLQRLDDWRPISDYWKEPEEKIQVVREGQLSLFASSSDEQGGSGDEHPSSDAEQGGSLAEHPSSDAEQSSSLAERASSSPERSSSVADPTVRREDPNNPNRTIQINNPNEQSKSNNPKGTSSSSRNGRLASSDVEHLNDDDDVQQAILDWMGFDGRLTKKDNAPSITLLLAWAFWVRLRGEKAKNPVGVARAGWRDGKFPESLVTGYAKENLRVVLDAPAGRVGQVLDGLVVEFGLPSWDSQIPAEYRDIVKR